jgi:hypothetical protein
MLSGFKVQGKVLTGIKDDGESMAAPCIQNLLSVGALAKGSSRAAGSGRPKV